MEKENTSFKEDKSFKEIYFLIMKHWKIVFFSILISVFSIAVYIKLVQPTYESYGSVLIEDPNQNVANVFSTDLGNAKNFIDNEVEILKSRTTAELAIKKLIESGEGYHILRNKNKSDDFYNINLLDEPDKLSLLVEDLQNSMTVENQRNTDVLKILVQSKDPEEAAVIVNTLIDVYVERDLDWVTGEMKHLKSFLKQQLKIKKEELDDIENKLNQFQEEEKIYLVSENYTLLLNDLNSVESSFYLLEAEINILEETKKYMYNLLSEDEKDLAKNISNAINSKLFSLRNEISEKESELITTIIQYGETHNAVLELENKIERLKESLSDEIDVLILNGIISSDPISYRQGIMDSLISVESQIPILISKKNEYRKLITNYDSLLSDLPVKVLEFTRLERDSRIKAETVLFMSQKLEETKINEASKITKIRELDRAVPDLIPIKPNKKLYLALGVIGGLFIGIGIIGLIEIFDNTIKSVEQIERRGFSLLSVIPSIGKKSKKRKNKRYIIQNKNLDKIKRRLITHEDPKSPISEAYRGLRTSLMYTKNEKKCRYLLVSSAGPGEGKTTTIANLAITYAHLGKKTLLIDTDLRKPVLHNLFKVDKTPGITSYLSANESDIDKLIHKTEISNLDLITSGIVPPNPSELLDSDLMVKLLGDLSKKYDVILFDSPPLIAVTDGYIMMKYINQFILVVRSGITQRMALDRVVATMSQSGFKETGVVLNAFEDSHSYGAGYYYNYYQYYYAENSSSD